jgi:hypothetical protein
MAKKKMKVARTVDYTNLERVVECFVDIYTRSRARAPIAIARRTRGLDNGSLPSQVDFLVDVQIAVRRKLKDAASRAAFWNYVFAAAKKGEDGIERRIGTECWAVRFAAETKNLIPSIYFRAVVREGAKDTSPLCNDIPRLGDIRKKYEKLRKDFEVMRAQRDIGAAQEADEANEPETDEDFNEQEFDQTAAPDVVALDGIGEFANQSEGLDYAEIEAQA